jgi:hypothetical protein
MRYPGRRPNPVGAWYRRRLETFALPRSRALTLLAVLAAVALIAVAVVYWAEPAGSLPSWWPGYAAHSGHHHTKHGIAAFLLGLACLAYAWFQTGKRPAEPVKRSAA